MAKLRPINLEAFLESIKGRQYKDLIQHHIRRQNSNKLLEAMIGTISWLPKSLTTLMTPFIDHINTLGANPDFWRKDCYEVFNIIIEEAYNELTLEDDLKRDKNGQLLYESKELLFNIFQIVTLNYACAASSDPKLRKFIGIKKGLFS